MSGHHVVLRIADAPSGAAIREAIARLAPALPDHSVFMSGVATITVHAVVSRARILERHDAIVQALAAYREACRTLVAAYEAGELAAEWDAGEHGEHCRFEHEQTGQIVEAPIGEVRELREVDPYFFGLFVETTRGLEVVAELIADPFHDTARILDVLRSLRERDEDPGEDPDHDRDRHDERRR